jgi:hypothetical protein
MTGQEFRNSQYVAMLKFTLPLHHAYCIAIGDDAKRVAEEIAEFLGRELGIVLRGNPDFWHSEHGVFGIDEARLLRDAAGRKALRAGKKFFVITANGMTREAQNALLKTVEEPAPDTHFFFLVKKPVTLLPTLCSRLFFVPHAPPREGLGAEGKQFLSLDIPARLQAIVARGKAVGEEGDARADALAFLEELECALASLPRNVSAAALAQVIVCKRYAAGRSPSRKLLLEHLALTLPRI